MTIRQLPEDFRQKLRERAAGNGRSMEAEARAILVSVVDPPAPEVVDNSWVDGFLEIGRMLREAGWELEIPPRRDSSRELDLDLR